MVAFSELQRCDAIVLFEEFGKVIGIVDATVLRNGLHLKQGGAQELSRGIHTSCGHIIGHCFSGFFVKQCRRIKVFPFQLRHLL